MAPKAPSRKRTPAAGATTKPTPINRATRRQLQRTKVPPLRVSSDSYTITSGGETYRPHAGEWVDVKGGTRLRDMLTAVALGELAAGFDGAPTPAALAAFKGQLDDLAAAVHERITDWSWTDDAEKPYASPPWLTDIQGLDFNELMWLATAGMQTPTSEAQKNA
jgi:hypothetical protein